MLFKRIIPIILILLFVSACDTLTGVTDDTSAQDTEEVVQVASDVPVVEPTVAEVDPTDVPVIEPTVAAVEATAVPIEPTTVPATAEPEPVAVSYNAPDWVNLPLTNAQTGETFTLADFAGKTVFVEPMATWCSNCRAQQGYVREAMAQVNADDFVFISLSVGENVTNSTLATYATNNDFPQIFVVAGTNFTSALVDEFGFTVTSPPSTPHFTISPIGTVSSLSTGFHQADALVEELLTAQNS